MGYSGAPYPEYKIAQFSFLQEIRNNTLTSLTTRLAWEMQTLRCMQEAEV
jgi:hypothetical protein